MKISQVEIQNFRGIRQATLPNLGGTVVIAGQNGSGKSCVLDAIRLVKSVYGGYQQNEWHHWMGEFQINFTNQENWANLQNNKSQPLQIKCSFQLHSAEREYIRANANELVRQSVLRAMYPELYAWSTFRAISLAAHMRGREEEIRVATESQVAQLLDELRADAVIGEFTLAPGGNPSVRPSKILEIIFGTFRPHFLGVLDYHGPHRMYGRETLQGINLNLDAVEQQQKAHALYNYVNKYANIKSEMASSYIKELISARAGNEKAQEQSLSNTLKELFRSFFPDKEFLGPNATVDGTLEFPVRTADGAVHDLNELSAGEKEILYGYLRLRNSAPRYSVILLDEPELHLNPRLIKGLPEFYHQHLGIALDNQIWLITHSDALLREAVGQDGFSVFHMQGASSVQDEQVKPLLAKEGLQRAVIDIVGDLAAYRPDAKLVIFEGEDSEFDQKMVSMLFPEFSRTVNMVSAGGKRRVAGLHSILGLALERGEVPLKIFSVIDMDDGIEPNPPHNSFTWDAYHIENYLLEPKYILKVLVDVGIDTLKTEEEVYSKLRDCAAETMTSLIRHRLSRKINTALMGSITTATDPNDKQLSKSLAAAVARSKDRFINAVETLGQEPQLEIDELALKTEFDAALAADTWRKKFRGRDILKSFASKHLSIDYKTFRNLILSRMRDDKYQPEGMRSVIQLIDG
jgi:predicted ATPase